MASFKFERSIFPTFMVKFLGVQAHKKSQKDKNPWKKKSCFFLQTTRVVLRFSTE